MTNSVTLIPGEVAFADNLRYLFNACLRSHAGYTVLNKVVLNQVLVSFGDADTTLRVIKGVQEEGTCWCGSTVWQGKTAMRISVSSWAHTDEDIQRSIDAILAVARRECA